MKRTIENLAKAFVGESQARNRYTFYASAARKEGYEQIGGIFELTANQEKEHANWAMKLIQELKSKSGERLDEIKIEAAVPVILGKTTDNLKAAIAGENYEHTSMYPEFAQTAEGEGLKETSGRLLSIAKAEAHHEERYTKILKALESGSIFKKDQAVSWVCRECGYEYVGTTPPLTCPSCGHPQSFYELKCEEY